MRRVDRRSTCTRAAPHRGLAEKLSPHCQSPYLSSCAIRRARGSPPPMHARGALQKQYRATVAGDQQFFLGDLPMPGERLAARSTSPGRAWTPATQLEGVCGVDWHLELEGAMMLSSRDVVMLSRLQSAHRPSRLGTAYCGSPLPRGPYVVLACTPLERRGETRGWPALSGLPATGHRST